MKNIIFSSWKERIIDNRGKASPYQEVPELSDLPEYFDQNQEIKALIGVHGIILCSGQVDIADLCRTYIQKVYEHSETCDKCNYCKTGMRELMEVLQDFCEADGREEDLEFMQTAAKAIIKYSKCSIGKLGPLPILHACKYFREELLLTGAGKTTVRKGKYYSKLTAPCIDACPVHIDIPKYIEAIKEAEFQKSIEVIREKISIPGVLGRVCVRFCEKKCRRANFDRPVAIKALKRFVADYEAREKKKPNCPISDSAKKGKIAVVGSGPCGITCAYHLALKGHKVTIFEKLSLAGGMMAVGIPEHRLDKKLLFNEISTLEQLGITIRTNHSLDKDNISALLKDRQFDAIFKATGMHIGKKLEVKGSLNKGIISGIKFLRDTALGKKTELGKKIIVIGGGNAAIDAAIAAKQISRADVTLVCIESAENMPAFEEEIKEAVKADIEIVHSFGVKEIKGENNRVTEIELQRCIRVFDQDGTFNPAYHPADIKTLYCDTIIVAIGQQAEEKLTPGHDISPVTFQTKTESIFAGGDAVYGPKSIIDAAASGRKAAISIDKFINKMPVEHDSDDYFDDFFRSLKIYDPDEVVELEESSRNSDPAKEEFSNIEAIAEAERCLRCYRVFTIAV